MKRLPTWRTILPSGTPLTLLAIVTSEEGLVVEAEGHLVWSVSGLSQTIGGSA